GAVRRIQLQPDRTGAAGDGQDLHLPQYIQPLIRRVRGQGDAGHALLQQGHPRLGVVGLKHVVFFDEIANTRFDDAESSISVLKDYMQTGKFSRGDQEFSAQCSIVRKRVIDQLAVMKPEEFRGVDFHSWEIVCPPVVR
ncbi:BREX system Lon protease-like protein BrxL, partial [Candidatus Methylomirabilis sp.]|uniref:BREX system Lon protease-like protein BrxL n=1 Tax=Candidatus Methylomirabilis sp. TaxID=2032687 RepID=UPI003076427A